MTINLKFSKIKSLKIYYISSHGEARNIKFGQSSSTSCFKYFVDKIQQILQERQLLSWWLISLEALVFGNETSQLIKAEAISPLNFYFSQLFSVIKLNSKAATTVVLLKKLTLKLLQNSQEKTFVRVFLIKLQASRTFARLVCYTHIRFCFSLGKTLKIH